eukprot:364296-Chlamydomonas_euryale.AAC.1
MLGSVAERMLSVAEPATARRLDMCRRARVVTHALPACPTPGFAPGMGWKWVRRHVPHVHMSRVVSNNLSRALAIRGSFGSFVGGNTHVGWRFWRLRGGRQQLLCIETSRANTGNKCVIHHTGNERVIHHMAKHPQAQSFSRHSLLSWAIHA